ncbi:ASCH domain-containing protein [Arcanobacterium hippocoleae]
MTEIIEPNTVDLDAFWTHAINAAQLNQAEAFTGQDDLISLRPAAFAFGDTAEMADRLCELVLAGKKRATSSYGPAYLAEDVDYPTVGDLGILCDGSGRPRALLRTSKVEIFAFTEVPASIAQLEGEYEDAANEAEAFNQWKAEHEDFFRRDFAQIGGDFDPKDDIIVEHLEILYKFDGAAA